MATLFPLLYPWFLTSAKSLVNIIAPLCMKVYRQFIAVHTSLCVNDSMKGKPRVQRLTVRLHRMPAPDAAERLLLAYELLLRAAKRSKEDTSTEEGADHLKKEEQQ